MTVVFSFPFLMKLYYDVYVGRIEFKLNTGYEHSFCRKRGFSVLKNCLSIRLINENTFVSHVRLNKKWYKYLGILTYLQSHL